MTKIYRTVHVKDEDGVKGRLPEKGGIYGVILKGSNGVFSQAFAPQSEFSPTVTHWLEEVELPSEEQIKLYYNSYISWPHDTFSKGAKWMMDLIFKNK